MNHRAHRGFIDTKPKGQRAHQHWHFVRHPALLVARTQTILHLPVIWDCGNSLLFQKIDSLLHLINGWRINNHVTTGIVAQGIYQKTGLRARVALAYYVSAVGAMRARTVLMRLAA